MPLGEPKLLRELGRRPWHQRRLVARLYYGLRGAQRFEPVRYDESAAMAELGNPI
jgi:hypothetical protein